MQPPRGLRTLIEHYEGDEQQPVRFRPATWHGALAPTNLPPETIEIITDPNVTRPSETVPGDRTIDRQSVHRVGRSTTVDDPTSLLRAFLLVQAWGAGTTGSRTLRHTRAAVDDRERLVDSLSATAEILRFSDEMDALAEAYRRWRCNGVRRSFFTKWFAFAGTREARPWQPLILDDRVFRTLNDTLRVSTKSMAGTSRWAKRYQAYVENLHHWAAETRVDAERLEWILFRHNGQSLP